jgi:hypothetical protein
MEINHEYKGYQLTLVCLNGTKHVFDLTVDEFFKKKQLIQWIDFLVKTDQWIPYDLYKDVFTIEEYEYKGLENIREFKVQYVEVVNKFIDVNLDLM